MIDNILQNHGVAPDQRQQSDQPFDFAKIKVVIKRPDKEETIFLDRVWARDNIPHFTQVIKEVHKSEGIEITLTCNVDAFKFAIKYLEVKNDPEQLQELFDTCATQ